MLLFAVKMEKPMVMNVKPNVMGKRYLPKESAILIHVLKMRIVLWWTDVRPAVTQVNV